MITKKVMTCIAVAIALLSGSLTVQAATIVITFVGSASGSLGGTPFPDSTFTIIATSDTTARRTFTSNDGYSIDHTSVSIAIAGLGVQNLTTGTRTFVTDDGLVGFARGVFSGSDLFDSNSPLLQLVGWDMLSSVGPVSGQGNVLQWNLSPQIETSGGILLFNSAQQVPMTFSAVVVVPEPALTGFLMIGIAFCQASRRRQMAPGA